MKKIFKGNTLPELMITITILGIVAILVISVTINIKSKINERSRKQAIAKITQIMRILNAKDSLHGITTTDEFVNILEENVKVIKRCNSDHLTECFPDKITKTTAQVIGSTSGLKQIETETLKTGADLGNPANTSNNVGLVLADGVSVILSYDISCESDPYNNNGITDKCIIAIFDINGQAKPNKLNEDIGLLNAQIGPGTCTDINGICVSVADIQYKPTNAEPFTGIPTAANNNCTGYNYWDGAKQACEEIGMRLPSISEASQIIFYNDKLNLTGDHYWTNEEISETKVRIYNYNGTYTTVQKGRMHHAYLVRCVK